MTKPGTSVSGYIRIRRYILTLVQKGGGRAQPLPSIRELSEQFHVSTPTVSRAMKELTAEGLVIGKRGIGAFANPAKAAVWLQGQPTVGILIGDGRLLHYSGYHSRILASLMVKTTDLPAVVHFVFLSSTNPEIMYQEILNERLDALIWHGSCDIDRDLVLRLEKSGLPVVLSIPDHTLPSCREIPSVYFNHTKFRKECVDLLVKEKRKRIVFLPMLEQWDQTELFREEFRKRAGTDLNPNLFLRDPTTCLDTLRHMMSLGAPVDAIFCSALGKEVHEILKELRVDTEHACRIIASELDVGAIEDFHGLVYRFPFEKHAEAVAGILGRILKKEPVENPIVPTDIEWDLK